MDRQVYWQKKLGRYANEEWSRLPSIFVQEVEAYFPPGAKILELGAGLGQDSAYLARKGYAVTWTDWSEYGREMAQERAEGENMDFKLVDMGQPLEIEEESYQVVYSSLGVHFFTTARTKKLFEEVGAILKPGGILALLVNSMNDPETKMFREVETGYYEDENGVRKRYFTEGELAELTTGMEIVLLDNQGTSYKDREKKVEGLLRLVARKV